MIFMTRQLFISFDVSHIAIKSKSLALSFLYAFKDEINNPIPDLESFRLVDSKKLLQWLEFHILNDLFLTDNEKYELRYIYFLIWNHHQMGIRDPHFRILQNDFTGIVTINKND